MIVFLLGFTGTDYCCLWLPQVYSVDNEDQAGASVEFILPRDLADGFVNNKKECYKFR